MCSDALDLRKKAVPNSLLYANSLSDVAVLVRRHETLKKLKDFSERHLKYRDF
jgi:hypothetical protein